MRIHTLLLIFFLLTLILTVVWRVYQKQFLITVAGSPYAIEGVLLNHPYVKAGYQTISLNGYVFKTGIYPKYSAGEYVQIVSRDKKPIGKINYYPRISRIVDKDILLLKLLSRLRGSIIHRIQSDFQEPVASIILGTTIGVRGDMPEPVAGLVKRSGITHILVVSGYNIALIVVLANYLFAGLSARVYFVSILVLIAGLVLIVGFEPPVLRAALVGTLNLIAVFTGDYRRALYLLFVSALFLLAIDPDNITDLSFQLSFAASGVLIAMADILPGYDISGLREQFVTVFFANLGVYPILSYYFGMLYPAGIIANPAVLWLVPLITVGGFGYMILPNILFKIFLVGVVDTMLFILRLIDSVGLPELKYQIPLPGILIYYLLVAVLFLFLRRWNANE